MASYNRFGTTATTLLTYYPGTVADDFGGTTVIEAALDRAARRAMTALPTAVFDLLIEPEAELLTDYATDGQTSFTIGQTPIVDGSVHLFRYACRPNGKPSYSNCQSATDLSDGEVDSDFFTVNNSTGAVTLSGLEASEGEHWYASYRVDMEAAGYSEDSLADVTYWGAACELGRKIYTEATSEWGLVTSYCEQWQSFIADAKAGEWMPASIRSLRWWSEPGPGTFGSVVISRG